MKKIEFGYSNDLEPSGSWEGIGIKQGVLLIDAAYYGAIEFNGDSFVVAKVEKDEYGRYPELVDNFIVRNAIADMYADGSGSLLLDQEKSMEATKIENLLNEPAIKSQINGINDILAVSNGIHRANKFFTILETEEKVVSTSITHNAFEAKNSALKRCHRTFSDMQRTLENQMSPMER